MAISEHWPGQREPGPGRGQGVAGKALWGVVWSAGKGLAEGRGCEPRGTGRCMNNCGGGLDLSVGFPKDGEQTGSKKKKKKL